MDKKWKAERMTQKERNLKGERMSSLNKELENKDNS